MALCSFAENYLMLGVTPVENLFIQEYLPRASGDYVRVYLYGLMQCYHPGAEMTLERMAHILDLSEETVRDAFQYWERQGLVRRISDKPQAYQYLNLAAAMANESPMDQAIYRHRDFNQRLQQLFGNRLLHPAEFMTACEWVEDLHLPEEVVLIMTEHYIESHGQKFQFRNLNKLALKWAEEGVCTETDAMERVAADSDAWKLCERVLKRFSLRRKPTLDEVNTVRKWLEEWKLSPDAVMAACAETIKGQNPSIGYLDGILSRNRNHTTAAAMTGSLTDEKRTDSAVRTIYEHLHQRGAAPTPADKEQYLKYIADGFEEEAVLRVARELGVLNPKTNMLQLNTAMKGFAARNQFRLEEIEEYFAERSVLREQAARILAACGLDRQPSASDIDKTEEWLKQYDVDLVLYAAECSKDKKLPLPYAGKLLENWKKLDLTTVELARRSHEAGRPAAAAQGTQNKPTPNALNFQQRTYQEGELDYLFDKMNKYDEEDEHDAQ